MVVADPFFILAPPRSFSSVVSAMLGQHPQMYGLPETQLFGTETMAEWWDLCSRASFPMTHGLLRAVSQLVFGEQTESTVQLATAWLRRRSHFTTGMIFEVLAEKVYPLILVEKSPSIVYRMEYLQRIYSMFPQAGFIHLVRHPRAQGESVMKAVREAAKFGPVPYWLLRLASYRVDGILPESCDPDPQRGWYLLHSNICRFLESVPDSRKLRVRSEDLLIDADTGLRQVAAWIGLRTDAEAIEEMKHPERSPYACFGPPGATYGNDTFFLESPALRPAQVKEQSLNGPLSWRGDGAGFSTEVKRLAWQFGYE